MSLQTLAKLVGHLAVNARSNYQIAITFSYCINLHH